jgi:hypothetical protein
MCGIQWRTLMETKGAIPMDASGEHERHIMMHLEIRHRIMMDGNKGTRNGAGEFMTENMRY